MAALIVKFSRGSPGVTSLVSIQVWVEWPAINNKDSLFTRDVPKDLEALSQEPETKTKTKTAKFSVVE